MSPIEDLGEASADQVIAEALEIGWAASGALVSRCFLSEGQLADISS